MSLHPGERQTARKRLSGRGDMANHVAAGAATVHHSEPRQPGISALAGQEALRVRGHLLPPSLRPWRNCCGCGCGVALAVAGHDAQRHLALLQEAGREEQGGAGKFDVK